jgi:hypothetical protein
MLLKAGAAALLFSLAVIADARAQECGREAFAGVVSNANAELTAINDANKRQFQEKLQLLKARAGWSEADFVAQATPFVRNERIAAFDSENQALLGRVSQLGAPGQTVASLAGVAPPFAASTDNRCAMLETLRQLMAGLVENTKAKWAYMTGNLDAALQGAGGTAAAR